MSHLKFALAAAALAITGQAHAAANFGFTATNGGTYTAPSVVSVANAIGSGGSGATQYTMAASDLNGNGTIEAQVVSGSVAGQYSAPYDTATHQLTTNYFSTGTDAFNLTFTSAQKYLGFLIGSVGAYPGYADIITFYNGSTVVGTIGGADITSNTSGAQTANNSYYINVNFASGFSFNKVVFTSQSPSMEFGNVVASAQNVPEPGMLGLFGVGVLGLGLTRRRKTA